MERILKVFADHPAWFWNDMLVVILFVATILFVIEKEQHPKAILLEAVGFIFLYSFLFDNFCISHLHVWLYGRSIFMFGGTILSMPLSEWLIVYIGLRMLGKASVPVWMQPFIIGLLAVLQDLSLDPVAVRQLTNGVGRWVWFMGPDWVQYLGIPIWNFTGWFILASLAATTFLAGRNFYEKSGYKSTVGYAYPIVAAMAASVLMGVFTKFIVWFKPVPYMLEPQIVEMGSPVEWVTLALWMTVGFVGVLMWRIRMKTPLDFRADWPIVLIPTVLHVADILGALFLGNTAVTLNAIVVAAIHSAIVFSAFVIIGKPHETAHALRNAHSSAQ